MEDSDVELNSDEENCFTFFICPCWLDSTTSRRFGDDGSDIQRIKNQLDEAGYESKSFQRKDLGEQNRYRIQM